MTAAVEQGAAVANAPRRRALIVPAVALAAVAVGAVGVWVGIGASAANSVEVYLDGKAVVCTGQDATWWSEDDPVDDVSHTAYNTAPAIQLREGLDCEIRYFVHNTSELEVTVTALRLHLMAPHSTGIEAVSVNGIPVDPEPSADHTDATLTFGERTEQAVGIGAVVLEADEALPLAVRVRLSDQACYAPGDSMIFDDGAISVSTAAWGIDATRPGAPGSLIALVGTEDTDCYQR
ncbi:MAG: hypothetical protein QM611_11460 [Microbacterium sp.]|uniref:hypothetical protein n=1 Tax=Microbacterium sp. TaxID=51671 RepID=UPI0039E66364